MKFYFSSKDIPELADLSIQDRREKLYFAEQKLTVPEKLILNLLKLIMFIPPFLFLARQEWEMLILSLAILFAIKLFIFNPIKMTFYKRHIIK
ncbi:DUF6170 family protein [Thalassotalea algicola]|uniref:DUF6170 family protein n=1 Tax=Thalassotalea algicola TaxID=2716224 RepID=UPI0038B58A6C